MILESFPVEVRIIISFILSGVIIIPVFVGLFRLAGTPIKTAIKIMLGAYAFSTFFISITIWWLVE
jgi:hypothetical protein